ncbi:class I SAM-dependent methyltransferase [Haloarchaeobius sp. HRN-SO-5]|uniref:class I SAM-dependent methyltransferase n=1 Tax=Haloarchaeobius sp. HRN-SO-5 TaxID=3446118 RepID=UPI003EB9BCD9
MASPPALENLENAVAYSSADAIETYRENAATTGLFEPERDILDRYFTTRGARVLDVGCGAGRTTVELDKRGFDVTGVDCSREMIRAAQELFPGVNVAVADATDLPFPNNSFPYVLYSYCGVDYIYPADQRLEALLEINRVLEPGGIFAFSTHNCLYNLPALVDDWKHLRNLYIENGNLRRLFDQYKIDGREYAVTTYISSPRRQHRQLECCGFEYVEYVGKRESPLQYLERRPYYVARKPEYADDTTPNTESQFSRGIDEVPPSESTG